MLIILYWTHCNCSRSLYSWRVKIQDLIQNMCSFNRIKVFSLIKYYVYVVLIRDTFILRKYSRNLCWAQTTSKHLFIIATIPRWLYWILIKWVDLLIVNMFCCNVLFVQQKRLVKLNILDVGEYLTMSSIIPWALVEYELIANEARSAVLAISSYTTRANSIIVLLCSQTLYKKQNTIQYNGLIGSS